MNKSVIAYYRVSTQKQGRSGLGLEAQRAAVLRFVEAEQLTVLAEFTEVETGKGSDALDRRPQLAAAIKLVRKHKAAICVAKLDRLTRDVHFGSGLAAQNIPVIDVQHPNDAPFFFNLRLSLAQEERRMISERTKAALQAARERGVKLGTPANGKANKQAAAKRAFELKPIFVELAELSARQIAQELNRRKVATPTGRPWSSKTVIRVQARL